MFEINVSRNGYSYQTEKFIGRDNFLNALARVLASSVNLPVKYEINMIDNCSYLFEICKDKSDEEFYEAIANEFYEFNLECEDVKILLKDLTNNIFM